MASGLVGPAFATGFVWLNDPNSTIDFSAASASCGPGVACVDNTYTVSGIQALNTGTAEADVGLFLPFIWPRDESQSPPQQTVVWDNFLGGWLTDSLGTSLLVTVHITTLGNLPNSIVLAGEVADETGLAVFGPNSDSPNVGAPFPQETLAATDLLPFVDLGSFGANEAKTFGLEFTYTFGDGRSCDLDTVSCRTTLTPFTLAPNTAVPEPGTWALMMVGFAGLGLLRYRKVRKASSL